MLINFEAEKDNYDPFAHLKNLIFAISLKLFDEAFELLIKIKIALEVLELCSFLPRVSPYLIIIF